MRRGGSSQVTYRRQPGLVRVPVPKAQRGTIFLIEFLPPTLSRLGEELIREPRPRRDAQRRFNLRWPRTVVDWLYGHRKGNC